MDNTQIFVERELRRIGVDRGRLGALKTAGPTADALLAWLRWLPTDLGHDEFIRRLDVWADGRGSKPASPDGDPAPSVDPAREPGSDGRA